MTRRITIIALLSWIVGGVAAFKLSAAPKPDIHDIQSAFVLKFGKFTQWPDDVFSGKQSPLVVAVVGEDEMFRAMERIVNGEEVQGRSIEAKRLEFPRMEDGDSVARFFEEARRCHIIYVDASQRSHVTRILTGLANADVLTVGDAPDFAEHGGMLGLSVRDGRVAFDANPDKIAQTRLVVSSHVLKLARIVKTRKD